MLALLQVAMALPTWDDNVGENERLATGFSK